MSSSLEDGRNPLQREGGGIPESTSPDTSPYQSKPSRFPTIRHDYDRIDSSEDVTHSRAVSQDVSPEPSPAPSIETLFDNEPWVGGRGLGLSGHRTSSQRVLLGNRASTSSLAPSNPFALPLDSPGISDSGRPLLESSPYTHNGGLGGATPRSEGEDDVLRGKASHFTENFIDPNGGGNGRHHHIHKHGPGCPPAGKEFYTKICSWLSFSVIITSLYSFIFSAIWLGIAIDQPRYGKHIRSSGPISPTVASTLTAAFAKSIEISLQASFVVCIGQILARRLLAKSSRGITIAEMTMRTWVTQPGFMFTHWQHVYHMRFSFLGALSLVAIIVVTFFTTASDSIVSPHLRYGILKHRLLYGAVQTQYANPEFITANCKTPVTLQMDPHQAGTECISIDYAGQAYHNSIAYLGTWAAIRESGGNSTNLTERPQAPGMLYDNTTVTGKWILLNTSDITAASHKYNRVINNVSLAMPHAGVLAAAHDPKNTIIQPEDLAGVGQYNVRAAVVSPAVNVLCVNMNRTELAPIIYTEWPNANTNTTTIPGQKVAWPGYESELQVIPGQKYSNATAVDDIFEWGEKYSRHTSIFPMYPIDNNTIINVTVPRTGNDTVPQNSDSIYLLAKSPFTTDYTLCQLRSFITPSCSTHYNVSGTTGGHIEAICEDPTCDMSYTRSVPDAPTLRNTDWRNVASQWMYSTSMNTGITNANASIARLLTQFVVLPTSGDVHLDANLPSLAEHLAVMVGSTLLTSTTLSTFKHYWDDANPSLPEPISMSFNASVASQEYTSGAMAKWQNMFYVILILAPLLALFCLVYFIKEHGLVTDYTEPQNLFSLALNSPPSNALAGSCGTGPEKEQLIANWHVDREDDSGHFYFRNVSGAGPAPSDFELRSRGTAVSRSNTVYSRLSNQRGSFL